MDRIKNILKSENYVLLKKYILLSVLAYLYIFIFLYVLVVFFYLNKTLSFIIVYASWYIILYTLQLKYLFKKKHDNNKVVRFYGTLLFFYLCANILYNLGIYFQIHYLISTLLTITILMPFRFIISKRFVFKD